MTNHKEIAEDLYSETVLIAYEKLLQIKNEKALLSYLFTIASRLYKLEKKRYSNKGDLPQNFEELYNVPSESETAYDAKALHEALKLLPDTHKEPIVLY